MTGTGTRRRATPLKQVKVSTEVWLVTALLHQEQPEREDWTIEEIVRRAEKEKLHSTVRAGLRAHVTLHCVANRKPNPARLRMLYATSKSGRRLYKPGDPCEEGRTGPTHPERGEAPTKYHPLLDWYEHEYAKPAEGGQDDWLRGMYEMVGMGKGMWADEHPDDYVRRLREGWD